MSDLEGSCSYNHATPDQGTGACRPANSRASGQWRESPNSWLSKLASGLSWTSRRGVERPSTADKRLLLFWPWFVECAFQKHYTNSTLSIVDSFSIPVSILIWCLVTPMSWGNVWELTKVLPPLAFEVWSCNFRYIKPERYVKHRALITFKRRLLIVPFLSTLLARPSSASSSWAAVLGQLWVGSGAAHTVAATFLFLSSWWVNVAALAVSAPLLASAASSSCQHTLAGPFPSAGWPTAAALMDKAALGIFKGSLGRAEYAQAVCAASLNTTLVVTSCSCGYISHWFERHQRLRFKKQVPPAVAAMQGHLYGLPAGLVAAQALLFVLYPALVLGWVLSGSWYGLWRAHTN